MELRCFFNCCLRRKGRFSDSVLPSITTTSLKFNKYGNFYLLILDKPFEFLLWSIEVDFFHMFKLRIGNSILGNVSILYLSSSSSAVPWYILDLLLTNSYKLCNTICVVWYLEFSLNNIKPWQPNMCWITWLFSIIAFLLLFTSFIFAILKFTFTFWWSKLTFI